MSDLTLSLLGLYNQDPEILDEDHLILPEGVDREVLLPMILSETAELEVIYPDPSTLKIVMAAWSTARSPSWERMLETLLENYDPLHNYDRTEVESGSNTGTDSESVTETISDTTAEDITDNRTGSRTSELGEDISDSNSETTSDSTDEMILDTTTGTTSTTATGQVTGFNSNSFADNNKTTTSGSSSDTANRDRSQSSSGGRDGTYTRDRSVDESESSQDRTVRDRDEAYSRERETGRTTSSTGGHSRNLRAYGNIGVTTSQAMLLEELRVRMTDIYRIITDELAAYFCLRVY